MYIILSQRKDLELSYSDDLYKTYHFPARYKNQISTGDTFVYYQGDRFDRTHRIYFGTGKIGTIYTTDEESYYAELYDCYTFENEIPIYLNNDEGYVETLGYDSIRKIPNPPWQSSIRPLSEQAYKHIISKAGKLIAIAENKNIDKLKNNLKAAIKGYYLGGYLENLRTAVTIANQILGENNITTFASGANLKSTPSVTSLIDYCRSMRMSYSYKPVLILSLLKSEKLSVTLSDAVDFFRCFYEERRRNGQKIEKQNCIYQSSSTSDAMIAKNILSNPLKALLKSGYFEYIADENIIRIIDSISQQITRDDIKMLESICHQKLYTYFSSLGK